MSTETFSPSQPDFKSRSAGEVQAKLQKDTTAEISTKYPDDERTHIRALAENKAYDKTQPSIRRNESSLQTIKQKQADFENSSLSTRESDINQNIRAELVDDLEKNLPALKQKQQTTMNTAGDKAELTYYADRPDKEGATK